MKEFVISYLTKGASSWAAITLLNNSPDQHTITVEVRRFHDGRQVKKLSIDLAAWQGEIVFTEEFPEVEHYRYTVVITGPDCLMVNHVYHGPWQITTVSAS